MNSGVFMKDKEIPKVFMRSPRIRPYVQRSDCPFYGFNKEFNTLVMEDSEDDQCALDMIITKRYSLCKSLCQMEIMRTRPDWYKCPLNTEENGRKLVESLEKIRVFPREYRPAKGKWNGFPLKIWMRHIKDLMDEE